MSFEQEALINLPMNVFERPHAQAEEQKLAKDRSTRASMRSGRQKTRRSFAMTMTMRSKVVLAALVSLACTMSYAQSTGEGTYKAKCQSCHGASGTPNPSLAKLLGVKPVSDPDIQKLTPEQMASAVKNGKGKMKPVAGLTDAQIKDVVTYYRGLK
jgi:mono/diheme cytochrome c family protein